MYSGDSDHLLGVSIGIAAFDPASDETLEQLIDRADSAMYQAKQDGNASCAVAPPAAATARPPADPADKKEKSQ